MRNLNQLINQLTEIQHNKPVFSICSFVLMFSLASIEQANHKTDMKNSKYLISPHSWFCFCNFMMLHNFIRYQNWKFWCQNWEICKMEISWNINCPIKSASCVCFKSQFPKPNLQRKLQGSPLLTKNHREATLLFFTTHFFRSCSISQKHFHKNNSV